MVAMLILAAAIGQISILFPMAFRLQQKAEDATNVASLGQHIMSEIRAGVRASTDYRIRPRGKPDGSEREVPIVTHETGFSDKFLNMRPRKVNEMPKEGSPWYDEIFNGRLEAVDPLLGWGVDEMAGGRGKKEKDPQSQPPDDKWVKWFMGDPEPWEPAKTYPALEFDGEEIWIGSPSPLLCNRVIDQYNLEHGTDHDNMETVFQESGSKRELLRSVMKYRWTAETVPDQADKPNTDRGLFDDVGFYDPKVIGKSMEVIRANNPNLSFEIFKGQHSPNRTHPYNDRPERNSYLKKVVVRVYWKDGTEHNRSTEFVSYVANY